MRYSIAIPPITSHGEHELALTTVTTTATSGSVATSPPSVEGNYRRFQVRTRGTTRTSYYSGWKVSTNSVRRNTVQVRLPPQSFSLKLQRRDHHADMEWGFRWNQYYQGILVLVEHLRITVHGAHRNVLTTLILSASGGGYSDVSRNPGTYTQFGIWTVDTLDVYSSEIDQ